MALTKYTASTAIIAALADLPNATSGLTATQLKAKFDENPEAFKTFVNNLIDQLEATTNGSSGADQIGATAITDLTGETVQSLLESLKTYADNLSMGAVTDNSVTDVKLSDGGTDIKARFTTHLNDDVTDAGGVHGLEIESGTWTPTIVGAITPGTHTYSFQTGKYVKINNVIYISALVGLTTKGVTMDGSVSIGGLPYTQDAEPRDIANIFHRNVNVGASCVSLSGSISGSNIAIVELRDDAQEASVISTSVKDGTLFRISATYLTT